MAALTSAQFRAARALLGWSMVETAKGAEVSVATIMHVEGRTRPRPIGNAESSLRAAYEAAGVVFTDGEGVRHRSP